MAIEIVDFPIKNGDVPRRLTKGNWWISTETYGISVASGGQLGSLQRHLVNSKPH